MAVPLRRIRAGLLVLAAAVVVAGGKASARGLQANRPPYCEDVTLLTFDGAIVASADNKIVYNNIGTTPEGTRLSLIISNTTTYTPSKEPSVYTGISGNIAQIGLHMDPTQGQAGGTCFDFNFVSADTGEPAIINNLIMTFFDLDNVHDQYCHEVLRACENAEYFTASPSQLEISRTDECTELMSMRPGNSDNNPSDAQNLTSSQREQSVGMHLTTPVSSVNVCFRVAGMCSETDRQLLFSGPSQIDGCQASNSPINTAVNVQPTTAAPTTLAPSTVPPTTAAPTEAVTTQEPAISTTRTTTSSLGVANMSGNSSVAASADPGSAIDATSQGSTEPADTVVVTDSGTVANPDASETTVSSTAASSPTVIHDGAATPKLKNATSDSTPKSPVGGVEVVASNTVGGPGPGDMVQPEQDACEANCFYDGQLETCYGLIDTVKNRGVSGVSESMKAAGVPCVNAWAVVRDQCSECGRCDLKRACVENLNELEPTKPPLVSGGMRVATVVALAMFLVAVSSISSLARRRAHATLDRTPESSDAENELLNPRV